MQVRYNYYCSYVVKNSLYTGLNLGSYISNATNVFFTDPFKQEFEAHLESPQRN